MRCGLSQTAFYTFFVKKFGVNRRNSGKTYRKSKKMTVSQPVDNKRLANLVNKWDNKREKTGQQMPQNPLPETV